MKRVMGCLLVVLLAAPAMRGDDKPKESDKPSTPKEQYQALTKEFQDAQQAAFKVMREAKTNEERQQANTEVRALAGKFAEKFLSLAEKNPKDPVAVEALVWVVMNNPMGAAARGPTSAGKAVDLLIKDHVASEKLGPICNMIAFGYDDATVERLQAILEKNPHKQVQAEACLALGQNLRQRGMVAARLKDNPELVKSFESFAGKENAEKLMKSDPAKLEAEAGKVYQMLAEKYLPDLSPDRIKNVCQQLSFGAGKGGESLMRSVMEKDERRDVQGVACLSLASAIKQRADETVEKDAKEAESLRREAEKLFETAADKYADVKMNFRGTVGERAKSELFEIRHLSIGLKAPDIEGDDQDGKKFKLSDYKGKVVLLDFWSEF